MARELDTISDDAAREAIRLLNELRTQTIAAILATREPFARTYRDLLREIDGLIVQFEQELRAGLNGHIAEAASSGDAEALAALTATGNPMPAGMVGVSPSLVRAASEYVADLVTDLGNGARGAITKEIRLAALGGTPVIDLIERIGRNLEDKSVFRTIRDRAEAIARTEVSRAHSTAYYEQSAEIAERHAGTEKEWVHAGFGRHARPNHLALDGVRIPFDEAFDLGNGITTPYPHHPSLPAGETVHCRCRIVLHVPEEV